MKSFEKDLIMSIRFSFNVFPLEQYQHERKFEARIDFFFDIFLVTMIFRGQFYREI